MQLNREDIQFPMFSNHLQPDGETLMLFLPPIIQTALLTNIKSSLIPKITHTCQGLDAAINKDAWRENK